MILELECYSPWLVWLFPISSSFIVPLFGRLGQRARDAFATSCGLVTLALSTSMIAGYCGGELISRKVEWIPVAGIDLGLCLDPLSILFANLVALLGFVVLAYSLSYIDREEGLNRYYSLMLLFIGSMIGLVLADNFLQMFIFWEIVGLCSYALVSFWYERPEAVKAGTKVFMMTKVGDASLLAGILLLYANLQTLSYGQVLERCGRVAMPAFTAISLLFLLGAVAKSAQLPLHTWLYGAMEAPTSVSCLLHGATMVKGGVYLIARTHAIFSSIPLWLNSVAWAGAATALVAGTLALHTRDIKGVQAYSTMSQNGLMFLALGVATSPVGTGWFAGVFHMVSHALFQGLGFLAVGCIVHQLGTRDMGKMGGLRRAMPITFALYLVATLSRSGMPPFSGFISKSLIAESVMASGNPVLTIIVYSVSALTFAYSYRSIVLPFAGEARNRLGDQGIREAPMGMSAPALVLAAGCLLLGFMGDPLARFLGFNIYLGAFWYEFIALAAVLSVGGLPIYLLYQRKAVWVESFRDWALARFDRLLREGYFFDFVYGKAAGAFVRAAGFLRSFESNFVARCPQAVGGGFEALAHAVREKIEAEILGALPSLISVFAMKFSNAALRGFDAALDKLVYFVANAALSRSERIRRADSYALPSYVLAVALGLLLLCLLLLLKVGG
ncbi:MAG: NADH-quinone oxidoreductase subunit L [Thermoproteota archaeon]